MQRCFVELTSNVYDAFAAGTRPAFVSTTFMTIPDFQGGSRVPYKSFEAPDGGRWSVWRVIPTSAERRKKDRRVATSSAYAGVERRRTPDRRSRSMGTRTRMVAGYENGWLCFESEQGEKRRLVPVPESWEAATADKLWMWCRAAERVVKCGPR
jgi:hypothetical protein